MSFYECEESAVVEFLKSESPPKRGFFANLTFLVFRKSLYYKDLGFQKKVEIHGNRVFGGDSKVKPLSARFGWNIR
jgi:hypothetical protein